MTKPWKTKEWREKRKELIKGKSCEWCASAEGLSIHHKRKAISTRAYYRLISGSWLRKLIKEGVYKPMKKEVCPQCCYSSIYIRKTMTPKYRCSRCKLTFEKPMKKLTSYVSRRDWLDFKRKYSSRINSEVRSKRQKSYEKYMSLKGTMILCKKCHMAAEKGFVLCKSCKRGYHKPRFAMCWNCFKKTEIGQKVARNYELSGRL
jgi:hypothetical protein